MTGVGAAGAGAGVLGGGQEGDSDRGAAVALTR